MKLDWKHFKKYGRYEEYFRPIAEDEMKGYEKKETKTVIIEIWKSKSKRVDSFKKYDYEKGGEYTFWRLINDTEDEKSKRAFNKS